MLQRLPPCHKIKKNFQINKRRRGGGEKEGKEGKNVHKILSDS
jgi:hypothetical protein